MSALTRSTRSLHSGCRSFVSYSPCRSPRNIIGHSSNLRYRCYSSATTFKQSSNATGNHAGKDEDGVSKTIVPSASSSQNVVRTVKSPASSGPQYWADFKKSYLDKPHNVTVFPKSDFPADWFHTKKLVTVQGQLQKVVVLSKDMSFAHIKTGQIEVQILCHKTPEINEILKKTPIGSAVRATGRIQRKFAPKKKDTAQTSSPPGSLKNAPSEQAHTSPKPEQGRHTETAPTTNTASSTPESAFASAKDAEVLVQDFVCINSFQSTNTGNPNDPSITHPPQSRHLQIRFDSQLAQRLQFRSDVVKFVRLHLKNFQEVETPILFKSTPEGAREFLVPTRQKGYAYALPQSPQQYKQMLIASGITRYFQFARCFRDEDMRADRQPEFTQIDLEMAWVNGRAVMNQVESLVRGLYAYFEKNPILADKLHKSSFPVMTYKDVMRNYGSDKPDLRIKGKITDVAKCAPASLQGMLTSLKHPKIDAWRFRTGASPKEVSNFVTKFLDSPEATVFHKNPDGGPGVAIFDSRAPLEGLQTFGHEGAEQLKTHWSRRGGAFEDGDLLMLQARQGPLQGGSTMLGKLRVAMYKAAVEDGLIEQPEGHHYLWVTKFPMFTPNDGIDPGQGGSAGFSATHHPFTAPYSIEDVELLRTNPLQAQADHYDLVVNGIELGGGSRRIHNVDMQKYVMRDVLKMSEERMNDFSHLFDALSSGCPPHAGFAIGFDRMIAVLTGRESVKDVIAFPKSSKGEDLMVKSPSLMTDEDLKTYHLALKGDNVSVGEGEPVIEARPEQQVKADESPSTS